MGINLQGLGRGLAAGVTNVSGILLTAEVQKQRDTRMAQYQQQSQQAQFEQQDATQGRQLEAQGIISERKIAADQQLASTKRDQAVADATTEHLRGQEDIKLRAALDPRATTVTTNVNGENRQTEFEKKLDSKGAELYDNLQNQFIAAESMDESLAVLEGIAEGFDTGRSNEALAKLGQWVGTDAGAAMQAFQSVTVPLVLDQASKLSGVISDKDMELLERSMPSFGNDPRANKLIVGTLRKGIERAKRNFNEADAFVEEKRTLRGFKPSFAVTSNTSEKAQESMSVADDPLGLFK